MLEKVSAAVPGAWPPAFPVASGGQEFFEGPVVHLDVFQPEQADKGDLVGRHLLTLAQAVADLGGIEADGLMTKAVYHGLGESHLHHAIVLVTEMVQHGVQKPFHFRRWIAVRPVAYHVDQGIQLAGDAPVPAIAA